MKRRAATIHMPFTSNLWLTLEWGQNSHQESELTDATVLNLGLVEHIEAITYGEPGNRTFNLTASSDRGEVVVWMEKEQILQVGVTLKQLIETRETTADPVPFDAGPPGFDPPITAEFKTGEMSLRHDSGSDVFTLRTQDPGGSEDSDAEVRELEFSFRRDDAEKLSEEILRIVAAGRKPCPLCSGPLNPGGDHFCVKVNGHYTGQE